MEHCFAGQAFRGRIREIWSYLFPGAKDLREFSPTGFAVAVSQMCKQRLQGMLGRAGGQFISNRRASRRRIKREKSTLWRRQR